MQIDITPKPLVCGELTWQEARTIEDEIAERGGTAFVEKRLVVVLPMRGESTIRTVVSTQSHQVHWRAGGHQVCWQAGGHTYITRSLEEWHEDRAAAWPVTTGKTEPTADQIINGLCRFALLCKDVNPQMMTAGIPIAAAYLTNPDKARELALELYRANPGGFDALLGIVNGDA